MNHPGAREAQRVLVRYLALSMQANESDNHVQRLRDAVLSAGASALHRELSALPGSPVSEQGVDLLCGTTYCGLPYVWSLLRSQSLDPVTAEQAWGRVVEHANEPGEDAAALIPPGPPPEPVLVAVRAAVQSWESALSSLMLESASGDPGATDRMAVIALRVDPAQDFLIQGQGFHLTEAPHPLTGFLRGGQYPLPHLLTSLPDGSAWSVSVMPLALMQAAISYAQLRRLEHAFVPLARVPAERVLQWQAGEGSEVLGAAMFLAMHAPGSGSPLAQVLADQMAESVQSFLRAPAD